MSADASPAVAVARIVAAAARDTPGVAGLHGGIAGEIATYGGGGKVGGVRVHTKPTRRATVHVIARYGRPLDELGEDVRNRIEQALEDALPEAVPLPVDVHIADVTVGEEALPEHADAGGARAGAVAQSSRDAPDPQPPGPSDPERHARGAGP